MAGGAYNILSAFCSALYTGKHLTSIASKLSLEYKGCKSILKYFAISIESYRGAQIGQR